MKRSRKMQEWLECGLLLLFFILILFVIWKILASSRIFEVTRNRRTRGERYYEPSFHCMSRYLNINYTIRCDSLELNNLWDGNNIPLSVRHAERFKTFTFNQVPVTPL